jgi:hypothetical protein
LTSFRQGFLGDRHGGQLTVEVADVGCACEFDPATFRALSDEDALAALMAASVGAGLGDEGDLEP